MFINKTRSTDLERFVGTSKRDVHFKRLEVRLFMRNTGIYTYIVLNAVLVSALTLKTDVLLSYVAEYYG